MNTENTNRTKIIIRTSVIGIAVNVLLAAFKAVIGVLSHSIAITLDAVNNISDAASSVITIVGARLAGRAPDRKHPFGYGRIEYLSAMIISLIVLYAGITSLTESVKKIIHPVTPDYSPVALIIIAVAVIVKIALGSYVKKTRQKVNSDSLINSGEDARLDAVISAATLVAAVLYLTTGLKIEAWLGAVISVIIIKSGIDMLRETLSKILGEGADASLARSIKETILSFPEVSGVYDMVLHNYGPDAYTGSVHVEIPDTCTASELDELLRTITVKVYKEHNIILTAVGVYSVNTKDPEIRAMRSRVSELVLSAPYIREFHGFYYNREKNSMRFDLVVSFDSPDRAATCAEAAKRVEAEYPGVSIQYAMDTDFTEAE